MKTRTFEIYRNGTHHATITATNKIEAKHSYANVVGNYNFELYEIKQYKLVYLDKQNNVLHESIDKFDNIQEARSISYNLGANSMINDLHKIKIQRYYEH
jgi:hypothetical protein